jgi:SSS family solute:Na+ symporter
LHGYNATNLDAEMGLPVLLKNILPVGFLGIVLSAYFSAIMSTADSCLMAASGNVLTDVLGMHRSKNSLLLSQLITLITGSVALLLALRMSSVLELMLHSDSFMVSGMIVPVLAALFLKRPDPLAALVSMLTGGGTTLLLIITGINLPLGLDANIYGIGIALTFYVIVDVFSDNKQVKSLF